MGRLRLIVRLAVRDLRRRRAEAVLLFVAITAATTTLALGLALHGVTASPYQATRDATAGPDVVAKLYAPDGEAAVSDADLARLAALAARPDVVAHSGPFPTTWGVLADRGRVAGVSVQGRDVAPAAVDRPRTVSGSWLAGDGTVVVERNLATALGVRPGDTVTLVGREFRVAGTAVTAAVAPFPAACLMTCEMTDDQLSRKNSGLVWVTRADARGLATADQPLYYRMNLRLADPAAVGVFDPGRPIDAILWTDIAREDARTTDVAQAYLLAGGMLLGILAIASVAVLVGGRMADQTRRVGLLKAVGGTPGLVAAVLLAEYLALALFAAGAGLGLGRLLAPEFTAGNDGLLGGVGTPVINAGAVGVVVGAAVLVAVFATFVPAVRAARMSTVRALRADARALKRRRLLFAVSRHLPVPLLLGLRLTLRRPRRFVLGVLSVAVTASGVFAVLSTQTHLSSQRFGGAAGLDNPLTLALDRVTLVLSVLLCGLAAVNTVFIAWSAVLDARQATSLSRALGASSGQVTGALVSAQVFPSLLGVLLGIPLGGLLLEAVNKAGVVWPPAWTLVVLVLGTVAVTALLTAVPARRSARTALVWASSP